MTQRYRLFTRSVTGLAIAGLVALGLGWYAPSSAEALPPPTGCGEIADQLPIPGSANKGTLCHFTGSDANPFVINEVSLNAVDSHQSHHGDCVRYYDGTLACF
jgi:hypothetical protein